MVAISVLILRYVPPNEVPLPSSLQAAIDSVSLRYSSGTRDINLENINDHVGVSGEDTPLILGTGVALVENSLIHKEVCGNFILNEENRRRIASWTIMLACVSAFVLTSAASTIGLPSSLRLTLCGIGGILLLSGLAVLTSIEQDDARHNFGHTGGFSCPFVPLLPIACILINAYLLINLGVATWTRVSIWLVVGVFVYAFYGRTHSTLQHAVYVPAVHVDEIYRESAISSN